MRVKLLRNWFAPNGELYVANQGPAEMPDSFKDALPSSAKILVEVEVEVEEEVPAKPKTK